MLSEEEIRNLKQANFTEFNEIAKEYLKHPGIKDLSKVDRGCLQLSLRLKETMSRLVLLDHILEDQKDQLTEAMKSTINDSDERTINFLCTIQDLLKKFKGFKK